MDRIGKSDKKQENMDSREMLQEETGRTWVAEGS